MTPKGAKVTVLTWIRDEEHIIPFFLRHYAFADRIIAWDNESRDSSRKMLLADPRVEVRDWITGGLLRDDELLKMKNEEYRKTGKGWNFIVDADEFVFHPEMLEFLDWCGNNGVTIPQTVGFDMVSDKLPSDDGGTLLTDLVKEGVSNPMYSKYCVVRDDCVVDYKYGAHGLKSAGGWAMSSRDPRLKLLHYRFLSKALVMDKAMRIRLSEQNRSLQVGIAQSNPVHMGKRWEWVWNHRVRVLT